MVREQRNSNIEGLRIIAMSFIVMGHFIAQSGYSDQFLSINSFILKCLGSGSRIAVNIFLLISVWYMVDSCFQAKKILKTYAQVWLFSAPLTLIALSVDVQNISIKAAAQGFFPFIGRGLWFASAYITLILFKPFLDMILQWEKRQRSLFVILLLFFISFVSTLPDMQNAYVCDSMWFLVVYLTVGDFKRRSLAMAGKASLYLISGGGSVFAPCDIIFFRNILCRTLCGISHT